LWKRNRRTGFGRAGSDGFHSASFSVGLGFGLRRVNTDPSLLDYFKPHTELRDGIEYVDRTGGSNPLTLVVSAADGSKLNTDAAYKKLWALHGALENHKDVGTVISLPTLLAEGDRTPFSFLISYEKMMQMLEQPKYARVGKSFINEDRSETVFTIRMLERKHDEHRLDVVDDLRALCRKYGFKAELVGGTYYLQGRLAKLVASSLVTGLFWLNLLFIIIAWIVARSVRVAIAMIVSLTLVPLCMLGGIGWFRVPMDVISAPATNVCIGIAIDSMIHLIFGVRRAQRDGKKGWSAWAAGRQEQFGLVGWPGCSSTFWPTYSSCRCWAGRNGSKRRPEWGIIVILDNRIVTKPCGRAFMQALPKCPVFHYESKGGTSRIVLTHKGSLDISDLSDLFTFEITIGSLEGDRTGNVFLGAKQLIVGSNNMSTVYSEVIQDGGIHGGTGGSLAKIGTRTLTPTGANLYTGGTTVTEGDLLVANRTGSATGTGPAQADGRIGGAGTIASAVTIGTGSGFGATLIPAAGTKKEVTTIIQSALTLKADATYNCAVNTITGAADSVVANGVTIDPSAVFVQHSRENGTLAPGTIITSINNTAVTPISGNFTGLTEGSTIVAGSNTYQVSYAGGDGNDFALTVL